MPGPPRRSAGRTTAPGFASTLLRQPRAGDEDDWQGDPISLPIPYHVHRRGSSSSNAAVWNLAPRLLVCRENTSTSVTMPVHRRFLARPIKRAGPAPVGPQRMGHIQALFESTSFTMISRSCRSRQCSEKTRQARGQTRGGDRQRQLPRPRHARAAARFPIRPCFARTQMALSPYKASKDRSRSA